MLDSPLHPVLRCVRTEALCSSPPTAPCAPPQEVEATHTFQDEYLPEIRTAFDTPVTSGVPCATPSAGACESEISDSLPVLDHVRAEAMHASPPATPRMATVQADDHPTVDVEPATVTQLGRNITPHSRITTTGEPMSARTPPSEPMPSTEEAARRLDKFTGEVLLERQTPLIAAPPQQRVTVKRPAVPFQSRRIAAQMMDHIPASKRGEFLLKRRLGTIPATAAPPSASGRSFDDLLTNDLSMDDVAAFDALFPATRSRVPRAPRFGRRPMAAAA